MKKNIKLMIALLLAITLGTNGASADTWDGQTLRQPRCDSQQQRCAANDQRHRVAGLYRHWRQ